ncbi:MAG: NDP-sugar synthase [Phycisphaerae bacterium]|nr:NDP-sugar synthase [Phycisphaerae bacterium]
MPIANRPLITYTLGWLNEGGVRSVSVCANSDTKVLRRCLGAGEPRELAIRYYEDHMPRGPAGCIRDAALETACDTLIVVDGTIMPQAMDLEHLLLAHARSNATMTIVVEAAHHGGAESGGPTVPVGIYVLAKRALGYIGSSGYQDIKETLVPRLREAGESIVPYVVKVPVPRVMDEESCLAANSWMLEQILQSAHVPEGYRRVGEALIHESARVDKKARLIGPVLIGPDTTVEGAVTLIGPTTVGAGCTLCEGAVISRSLFWDGVRVGRNRALDRCILTRNVEVKAARPTL